MTERNLAGDLPGAGLADVAMQAFQPLPEFGETRHFVGRLSSGLGHAQQHATARKKL
jgi:hypothetical protein